MANATSPCRRYAAEPTTSCRSRSTATTSSLRSNGRSSCAGSIASASSSGWPSNGTHASPRTPLAAISGSARTLLRDDIELDQSGQKRLLAVIAQESERLSRIADDILFANKLDSGHFALGESTVDLRTLAKDVVDELRACFAARDDISIELSVPAELDSLVADSDKLRQVLINLIDNPVKYSPDGGRIEG